jgi:tetratricopeptide (TPR) repeat protein
LGDPAHALPAQLEQIELDHRLGDRNRESIGLGNLGDAYVTMGLYKKARPILDQAMSINLALGASRIVGYNRLTLGDIHRATGDLLKARHYYEQALKDISPSRDELGIAISLVCQAWVLLEMGDASGAARNFETTLHMAAQHESIAGFLACESNVGLAACAIQQGRLEDARQYANAAWEYLKGPGRVWMGHQGLLFRSCAETFEALGDTETTIQVLKKGHQVITALADGINIPEWRKIYLEDVPDNRLFLEMWERLVKA